MACWNVIDHTELSGTATIWTKDSIPSSYDHLCVKTSQRVDASVYEQSTDLTFNASGTGYSYTYINTTGTSTYTSHRASSQGRILGPYSSGASTLADNFAVSTIWIPNYANTSNYKSVMFSNKVENNTHTTNQWKILNVSGLWSNTDAIDEIKIETSGGNFVQYSSFTLYGINGAA